MKTSARSENQISKLRFANSSSRNVQRRALSDGFCLTSPEDAKLPTDNSHSGLQVQRFKYIKVTQDAFRFLSSHFRSTAQYCAQTNAVYCLCKTAQRYKSHVLRSISNEPYLHRRRNLEKSEGMISRSADRRSGQNHSSEASKRHSSTRSLLALFTSE